MAVSTLVVITGDTGKMLMKRAPSMAVSIMAEAGEAIWGVNPVEPPVVVMGEDNRGAAQAKEGSAAVLPMEAT